jgi:hypothetical protein
MSFWRYVFDVDMSRHADIGAAPAALANTHLLGDSFREQKLRLDRLELLVQALFTHLERHGQLDRAQLAALVEQIDLADGALDGRIGPDGSGEAPKCGHCGKPVTRLRDRCVYCGAASVDDDGFPAPPFR